MHLKKALYLFIGLFLSEFLISQESVAVTSNKNSAEASYIQKVFKDLNEDKYVFVNDCENLNCNETLENINADTLYKLDLFIDSDNISLALIKIDIENSKLLISSLETCEGCSYFEFLDFFKSLDFQSERINYFDTSPIFKVVEVPDQDNRQYSELQINTNNDYKVQVNGMDFGSGTIVIKGETNSLATVTVNDFRFQEYESAVTFGQDSLLNINLERKTIAVNIDSFPSGGSVNINGDNVGVTPLEINSFLGLSYDISLRLEGHNNYDLKRTFTTESPVFIRHDFVRQTGRISIQLNKPNKDVLIKLNGGDPEILSTFVNRRGIRELPTGEYEIELIYKELVEKFKIKITNNKESTIKYNFVDDIDIPITF